MGVGYMIFWRYVRGKIWRPLGIEPSRDGFPVFHSLRLAQRFIRQEILVHKACSKRKIVIAAMECRYSTQSNVVFQMDSVKETPPAVW